MRHVFRVLLLLSVVAPLLAFVLGCQPAPQRGGVDIHVNVVCPRCQGHNSATCPWCHGNPYDPERWRK